MRRTQPEERRTSSAPDTRNASPCGLSGSSCFHMMDIGRSGSSYSFSLCPLRRNEEVIHVHTLLAGDLVFCIDRNSVQVSPLNHVQILAPPNSQRAGRSNSLMDRHRIDDAFDDIELRQAVCLHLETCFVTERISSSQDESLDDNKCIAHRLLRSSLHPGSGLARSLGAFNDPRLKTPPLP